MGTFPRSDLHIHPAPFGGTSSPREMILSAIDAGMDAVGLAVRHPHPAFSDALYDELQALKSEFSDRIRVLIGIEQDAMSPECERHADYIIGAVHRLSRAGQTCSLKDADAVREAIRLHWGGDAFQFARAYYETAANVERLTACDIIGHFDLLSHAAALETIFDETDPRYLRVALDAIDALLEKGVIFEINTMDFTSRKRIYPSPVLLRHIAYRGGAVTPASGAGTKELLCHAFPDACRLARACGFGSILGMTRSGWNSFGI